MKNIKKVIALILASVMMLSINLPTFALPAIGPNPSTLITRDEYRDFEGTRHTANNATRLIADGVTLVADNNIYLQWYIRVDSDTTTGSITVAYQISNRHYMRTIEISGAGRYVIGDSRGRDGLNEIKLGEFVSATMPDPSDPDPLPDPDNGPYIRVTTQFPTGVVTRSFVDIEYLARASYGEDIVTITFLTNDSFYGTLFYRGSQHVPPVGTLGEARVFILPGRNNQIKFTLTDSAGRTATQVIQLDIVLDEGFNPPPLHEDQLWRGSLDHHRLFASNRILLGAHMGVTFEEVERAAAMFDGEIIGWCTITDLYTIQFGPIGHGALVTIIEYLTLMMFPHLFDFGSLWYYEENAPRYYEGYENFSPFNESPIISESPEWRGCTCYPAHPNCPCNTNCRCGFTHSPDWRHRTRDAWWQPGAAATEWGLTAVNIPAAWPILGNNMRRNINVGIVDNGVMHTHVDLLIPSANIGHFLDEPITNRAHGTHVISTIGAIHNNQGIGRDLAGVINICRNNLFSFDSFDILRTDGSQGTSDMAILTGLRWNVVRGARVINFSLGVNSMDGTPPFAQTYADNLYIRQMQRLLDLGYDFLVVQAAGNMRIDAGRNGIFSHIAEGHPLRSRIITVGATQQLDDGSIEIADFTIQRTNNQVVNHNGQDVQIETQWLGGSNFGTLVDVVAPSHTIWGAGIANSISLRTTSGTSMAAPHVSGVAALVWSEHPGMTGAQVRDIIIESAQIPVNNILDERIAEVARPNWSIEPDGTINHVIPERPAILRDANGQPLVYHHLNAAGALTIANDMTSTVLNISRIVGQVVCEITGNPISHAQVRLYQLPDDQLTVIRFTNSSIGCNCNEDNRTCVVWYRAGHFRMGSIPAGDYFLTISAGGFVTQRFDFPSIEPGVEVALASLRLLPLNADTARPLDSIPSRWVNGVEFVRLSLVTEAYGFTQLEWDSVTRIVTIHDMDNGIINVDAAGGFLDAEWGRVYVPRAFAWEFFAP